MTVVIGGSGRSHVHATNFSGILQSFNSTVGVDVCVSGLNEGIVSVGPVKASGASGANTNGNCRSSGASIYRRSKNKRREHWRG